MDIIDYIEARGYFVQYRSDPLYVQNGYREIRIITYPDSTLEKVFMYNLVVSREMPYDYLKAMVDHCLYELDQTVTQYRLIESTY